ncbi:GntR family transcriptional regulator [Roseinatronobacter alkalisoli]|uniref:GntR family transcriptional regulator n=1 Tax=Roseinatronobacter alkalisoli TaxID=3028235 RepID=A0ABT5T3A7_9RHOB|nr:GntR family transcriptional regulator [Roseinatronobacter sp. HJB301]MDD7969608.1 GntR family transcriptional regulator [Roseinatronobacter sp. HJB301]
MTGRQPTHQIAYLALRDMVLFGELAPGDAVTIEGLVARLGLGMTPIREAIRRLIAEGALQLLGNRRVCVPRLTEAALADLQYAREAVETRLAEQAAGRCDVATLRALRETDTRLDSAIAMGDIPAYLRENHAFHFTLYACAGSDVLEALAASLWLRFGPSLRVVCQGPAGAGARGADGETLHMPDHHKRALAALEAGDRPALKAALRDDIAQGVANIRAGLQAGVFG